MTDAYQTFDDIPELTAHGTGRRPMKFGGWHLLVPRRMSSLTHDETGSTKCETWIAWLGRTWRERTVWTMRNTGLEDD